MIHVNLTFVLPFPFHELHVWSIKIYEKLFQLWYKVAHKTNTFFPELETTYSSKDALKYIKTHVAGVSAKTARRYL